MAVVALYFVSAGATANDQYSKAVKRQLHCEQQGANAVQMFKMSTEEKSAALKLATERVKETNYAPTDVSVFKSVLAAITASTEKEAYMKVWAQCMDET